MFSSQHIITVVMEYREKQSRCRNTVFQSSRKRKGALMGMAPIGAQAIGFKIKGERIHLDTFVIRRDTSRIRRDIGRLEKTNQEASLRYVIMENYEKGKSAVRKMGYKNRSKPFLYISAQAAWKTVRSSRQIATISCPQTHPVSSPSRWSWT